MALLRSGEKSNYQRIGEIIMNYENVKDALKELVALNSPGTTFGKVSTITDSGVKTGERKFEVKDLQESNYELLANVCDLLGMSDIYLDEEE